MKNFCLKYPFLICNIIVSFLVFVFLAVELITKGKMIYYDSIIANLFNNVAAHHSDKFAFFITCFGDSLIISVFLLITIFIMVLHKRFKESLFLLLTTTSGFTLTFFLKLVFERVRPEVKIPLVHPIGYSFPSGHSASAACFYGALIYLAFIFIPNKILKTIIICLLGLLIVLVGISRVYLGAHYPTDVLGGFSLGFFVVNLWILLFRDHFIT
jgi:undecaprenyl-diphosphatase